MGSRADSYGSSVVGGYEDTFAPENYGRSGGGGTDKPFVAATSPWANTQDEFSGYTPSYDSGSTGRSTGDRRPGLPARPQGSRNY
jgi:hypothetical protein